uniref:Nucleoprotein n=3 Tax=Canary bornavirus 2 TaxID=1715290 RepID=M9V5E6_9MONO|nr:nucleoprotein [Canary bornavirus 2]AGJ74909.1 nucleoprotein [Canary bornavirus 2]AGJ74914.1 nucleoprotein [Canary bornavirus 2]AOF44331.1 nucleoprotein [Canary bornavirus 2]AOF44335.1 nucleoprotein [Canary bornavirus 2]
MPPKRRLMDSPEDMDEQSTSDRPDHMPKLPGTFLQYTSGGTDPHPGIGDEKDIKKNALAFLDPSRREKFHSVTPSLVFLCLLIPGLHRALLYGGVPRESYLSTVVDRGGEQIIKAGRFYGEKLVDRELSELEVSSIFNHCCSLLIGVVIGSSAKIKAGAEQIKKRFKTLMASLNRPAHGETATLLQMFNPHEAIDWINGQPWVGSLVLSLITTDFESPGKEFMDQIKLVASYAQMTTYTTIKEYLSECMDATLTIPAVAYEIKEFIKVSSDLKTEHGELFKYLGAIRHSDAIKLAPRNFPNLASAAFYWSKKENPTMSGYRASTIQPGSTVKEAQLARYRRREISRGEDGVHLSEEIAEIMRMIGVTGLQP